ncbi:lantibiotic dehydratase [Echinicola sp. CAU 1574]|uniref:Lantibiotic dehydratase n=1 Tax=Echinicola arenosa TaxID=2774144 RepID=A0ABR9ALC3_9BACT|nr:thiopeptide-type bacteriocin biosynthesis protein [Echinicola arenosa]MBD8489167.1 lantibiotic dehydratase [Echinicola arenosa]
MEEYLYRLPLLDFDIYNDQAVNDNYGRILDAVSLSSRSFYHAIKEKTLDELSVKEKKVLRKYLLRGRYRPIPFGKWAGVGLGKWTNASQLPPINTLEYSGICTVHDDFSCRKTQEKRSSLNPFLYKVKKGFVLWELISEEERWGEVFLQEGRILSLINKYLEEEKVIDFSGFNQLFDAQIPYGSIQTIWEELHLSGFLIEENQTVKATAKEAPRSKGGNEFIFSKLNGNLNQTASIKAVVKMAYEELGALMQPMSSAFLDKFKSVYFSTYDDRFVPLKKLLEPYSKVHDFLVHPDDAMEKEGNHENGVLNPYLGLSGKAYHEVVDLSEFIKAKRCEVSHHLTVLYRLGEKNSIVLDDMVGDRSFGILGRFTHDTEIFKYAKQIGSSLTMDGDVIYADVCYEENPKNNYLTAHRNILSYKIDMMGNSVGNLHLNDLYIGFDQTRIVLYHIKLKKEVVPVFQHVLNRNLISHPIARLLWEMAHQNVLSLKFNQEVPPHVKYLPRLIWKEIILCPAKWLLHYRPVKDFRGIRKEIEKRKLPRYLLIGEMDQELLIDIEDPLSVDILLDELKSRKELWVKECIWIKNRSYFQKDSPLFPQFLVTVEKKERPRLEQVNFNPIEVREEDWAVVYVYLSQQLVLDFLVNELASFLDRVERYHGVEQWHYLCYRDPNYHLRLRFKLSDINRASFEKDLYLFLKESNEVISFCPRDYYPELLKYGAKGIAVSEKLFALESKFLLMSSNSLLLEDEEYRLVFVVKVIVCLLKDKWKSWYPYLVNFVKKILLERRKYFKRWSEGIDFNEENMSVEELRIFVAGYLNMMGNHSKLEHNDEQQISLARNHFHMFINRLFPEINSNSTEDFVWYCVYGELGRMVHKV